MPKKRVPKTIYVDSKENARIWAQQLKVVIDALLSQGFTSDQAFQLLLLVLQKQK